MQSLHLLYHEIRATASTYSYVVEREQFVRQMGLFVRARAVAHEQAATHLWPEITFDDGHISNLEVALPVLAEHGLQARFFITAGWTGSKQDYMDGAQLRALHQAGQHIGAHGWTHTLLTHCTPAQLDHELRDARTALEDTLGASVRTISLPGGRFNQRVLAACRDAGYTTVYTSIPKPEPMAPENSQMLRTIGRINLRGDMSLAQIEALLIPGNAALKSQSRQYRIKAAAQALLGDTAYARLWALLNRHEPAPERMAEEVASR